MEAAQAARDEAAKLFVTKQYAEAEAKFLEARSLLAKVSDSPEKKKLALSCALNLASCSLFQNKADAAVDFSTEAVDIDKKSAKAYYRRGQALRLKKEFSRARFDLMMALELSNGDADIQAELDSMRQEIAATGASASSTAPSMPTSTGFGGSGAQADFLKEALAGLGGNAGSRRESLLRAMAAAPPPEPTGPVDVPAGLKDLASKAEAGDATSQLELGEHYENGTGGCVKRASEAYKWYRRAAEAGDAKAQNYTAWCLKTGTGVAKNDGQAVEWYTKSANQGYCKAQACLGFCYDKGDGVVADAAQAAAWYRKAGDQGDSVAQVNLALCYEKGRGVEQSHEEAVHWFKRAAELGNVNAYVNVGVAYEKGEGVAKNMTTAFEWYMKAAKTGDSTAQAIVGCCYEKGLGVSESRSDAMSWYQRSAAQGNGHAQQGLKRVLEMA
eukprot:PhM_4_TR6273/c0_g1_i1/m.30272/K07126/K07126; uncharacterized protein